jgi:hypothetical protein
MCHLQTDHIDLYQAPTSTGVLLAMTRAQIEKEHRASLGSDNQQLTASSRLGREIGK